MGKIEIYGIIASPPTRAVMVVAKALGIPHELKILDPLNKPPGLEKLSPQTTIPFIVDGDLVLPER